MISWKIRVAPLAIWIWRSISARRAASAEGAAFAAASSARVSSRSFSSRSSRCSRVGGDCCATEAGAAARQQKIETAKAVTRVFQEIIAKIPPVEIADREKTSRRRDRRGR